ncbi:MAG: hypothetical protein DRI69_12185 [Bacteroidetes bacterium]|nr:MAG: hypothetical protein DRI69_12185 [Bacteroidota bacterium]
MAYCTNAELTLLTGTTLSTVIQDAIIDQADREINARLEAAGITPPVADDLLKFASIDLSKIGIITHNRMTGAQTKSVKIGDITIQDDLDAEIAALRAHAWKILEGYVSLNADSMVPVSRIVGRSGVRIGEYEEMTAEEEEEY